MVGCASPTLCGDEPVARYCSKGTFIQSATESNRLAFNCWPRPVRCRSRSASNTAAYADIPQAMSQTETPTRPGPAGCPEMAASPLSA